MPQLTDQCSIEFDLFEGKWRILLNGDVVGNSAFCGDSPSDPKQRWPFKDDQWMLVESEKEAEENARKLESYRRARAGNKAKKKKKE